MRSLRSRRKNNDSTIYVEHLWRFPMSSTATLSLPYSYSRTSRMLSIFMRETRYEFVRAMRTKAFSLYVIGFPVMFYMLFGVMNRGQAIQGQIVAKYMLAGYAAFGVVGAALFGI